MKLLQQRVSGVLHWVGERAALVWDETAGPVYLRFLLPEIEREEGIFPALLLDDWGQEIKSLELYEWVRENGVNFPRAEIFGIDRNGQAAQVFLRELELFGKYPCYAYEDKAAPVTAGVQVVAIVLADKETVEPERIKRPAGVTGPLRYARVSWWQANPEVTDWGFAIGADS
jgi:hypothetical protein